jgi:hypothetical protein
VIPNPPQAVKLCREHALLTRSGMDPATTARHLAAVILRLLGPMSWHDFSAYWNLHLQSIPWDTATAAWGLTLTVKTATTTNRHP